MSVTLQRLAITVKLPNPHLAAAPRPAGRPGWRTAVSHAGLVRIIKRKLKKIQYRPHLRHFDRYISL